MKKSAKFLNLLIIASKYIHTSSDYNKLKEWNEKILQKMSKYSESSLNLLLVIWQCDNVCCGTFRRKLKTEKCAASSWYYSYLQKMSTL